MPRRSTKSRWAVLSAAFFFVPQSSLDDIDLVVAVIDMPLLTAIWLIWMLGDMKTTINKGQIA